MTSMEETAKHSLETDEDVEENTLDAVSLYESCKKKYFKKVTIVGWPNKTLSEQKYNRNNVSSFSFR